mmetsp:Transcript_6983/g.5780  ORF Transcript_6983/g.5780 Transcript_6983/m.5780 type:complete len:90 (+) Transcript_6983:206-475(+)
MISARKGEFETGFDKGGQTREHAMLAKTLGVNKLIVTVNKMDDPTVNWSKDRYDQIVDKLTPFLVDILQLEPHILTGISVLIFIIFNVD